MHRQKMIEKWSQSTLFIERFCWSNRSINDEIFPPQYTSDTSSTQPVVKGTRNRAIQWNKLQDICILIGKPDVNYYKVTGD